MPDTTIDIETKTNGTVTGEFATNRPSELNSTTQGDSARVTVEVSDSAFDTLRTYDPLAGTYRLSETLAGEVYYAESIPTGTIGSLAVGIEPSADLKSRAVPGVWALIDAVVDERTPSLTTNRITLETTVLAPYDEHADHTALETAIKL